MEIIDHESNDSDQQHYTPHKFDAIAYCNVRSTESSLQLDYYNVSNLYLLHRGCSASRPLSVGYFHRTGPSIYQGGRDFRKQCKRLRLMSRCIQRKRRYLQDIKRQLLLWERPCHCLASHVIMPCDRNMAKEEEPKQRFNPLHSSLRLVHDYFVSNMGFGRLFCANSSDHEWETDDR